MQPERIKLFSSDPSNQVTPLEPAVATVTSEFGNSNEITLTANAAGLQYNGASLVLVDPAANDSALSVSLAGRVCTVSLATNGSGVITTTVDELPALVATVAGIEFAVTTSDTAAAEAGTLTLAGGVSGTVLKTGEAIFDATNIYFAVGDTTVTDSTNLRKIAHSAAF